MCIELLSSATRVFTTTTTRRHEQLRSCDNGSCTVSWYLQAHSALRTSTTASLLGEYTKSTHESGSMNTFELHR